MGMLCIHFWISLTSLVDTRNFPNNWSLVSISSLSAVTAASSWPSLSSTSVFSLWCRTSRDCSFLCLDSSNCKYGRSNHNESNLETNLVNKTRIYNILYFLNRFFVDHFTITFLALSQSAFSRSFISFSCSFSCWTFTISISLLNFSCNFLFSPCKE